MPNPRNDVVAPDSIDPLVAIGEDDRLVHPILGSSASALARGGASQDWRPSGQNSTDETLAPSSVRRATTAGLRSYGQIRNMKPPPPAPLILPPSAPRLRASS